MTPGGAMTLGPVQLLVLGSPEPDFHGRIAGELERPRTRTTETAERHRRRGRAAPGSRSAAFSRRSRSSSARSSSSRKVRPPVPARSSCTCDMALPPDTGCAARFGPPALADLARTG
jgi:hypothetical protein